MEATNIFAKLATKYEAGFDDFLPKRVQILAKGFAEGWDLVRCKKNFWRRSVKLFMPGVFLKRD